MFAGTERDVVLQETVMTRQGVDRVLRFAFELASERDGGHRLRAFRAPQLAGAEKPKRNSDPAFGLRLPTPAVAKLKRIRDPKIRLRFPPSAP